MTRTGISLFACLMVIGCASAPESNDGGATAPKVLVNRDNSGVAINGYDPVAYFTAGRPVRGNETYTAQFQGATYRFASAEHRDAFALEPAKYAPQFGGYCGYAASINKLSPTHPDFWQVIDGRLVLQHNQRALDLWNKNVAGNLVMADENWPSLVARNGKPPRTLVNVDSNGVALDGYDPVAYFTEGKAVKGKPEILANYNRATYHFASVANKDAFEREPAKFEPQFGGYCGYAASINRISPIDVQIFQIVDGRLVLQHTPKAYDLFNKDLAASLARADRNWPGLVARKGR
ncbi:MAG: YHS domain-containing (seleno)protein [Planctomycetota bacterium]